MSQPEPDPLLSILAEGLKETLLMVEKIKKLDAISTKPLLPISYNQSLPKIFLLAEASEGSRILHGLVGLTLPSDFNFPIVLNFESDSSVVSSRKIIFEFNKDSQTQKVITDESMLEKEISFYLKDVPEEERPHVEVILTILKPNVNSFTIVYLPNISDQSQIHLFKGYIKRYTGVRRSLFLNVLPSSTDIDASLSRKLLSDLDYEGKCTITIFTQLGGVATEDIISQITSTKISILTPFGSILIPFGYYFVKDVATIKDSEKSERQDTFLSKIDKEFIGYEKISAGVVASMGAIIFRPNNPLTKCINSHLNEAENELKVFKKSFTSVADASEKISTVVTSAIVSLNKLFELPHYIFDEHSHVLHVGSQLATRYRDFITKMKELSFDKEAPFLKAEMDLLVRRNPVMMTSTLGSSTVEQELLEEQFKYASDTIDVFVCNIQLYLHNVVVKVLLDHSKEYKQIHPKLKNIGRVSVENMIENFRRKLEVILEHENKFIYSCNPLFEKKVKEAMKVKLDLPLEKKDGKKVVNLPFVGDEIRVDHLDEYLLSDVYKAFELKMIMIVYWEFVVERFVDNFAFALKTCVSEMLAGEIKRVMDENLKKFVTLSTGDPDARTYNERTLVNKISDLKKAKEELEMWLYGLESFI